MASSTREQQRALAVAVGTRRVALVVEEHLRGGMERDGVGRDGMRWDRMRETGKPKSGLFQSPLVWDGMWLLIACITAAWPARAARVIAYCPLPSHTPASAACSRSQHTSSECPNPLPKWSAVSSASFVEFTDAPAATITCTAANSPKLAAQWRAVSPALSPLCGSAPPSKSARTTLV